MLVNGAIIPPRTVLEAVSAVVTSVPVPGDDEAASPSRRGGLFGRRRNEPAAEPAAAMLEHVPVERMQLPITGFGNLTNNDAHRVADAIRSEVEGWSAPTVRLAGGTALDFPGDWSVWARLEGDVESLGAIARGVTQCVERLGLFVDRRLFRPMLAVATVTPATTGPYLQSVVDALDSFAGEEWTVELSLTKETFVGGRPEMAEFQRIVLPG